MRRYRKRSIFQNRIDCSEHALIFSYAPHTWNEESVRPRGKKQLKYHGFRYTNMIGKAWMTMKAALTFKCINLKKPTKIKRESPSLGGCFMRLLPRFVNAFFFPFITKTSQSHNSQLSITQTIGKVSPRLCVARLCRWSERSRPKRQLVFHVFLFLLKLILFSFPCIKRPIFPW